MPQFYIHFLAGLSVLLGFLGMFWCIGMVVIGSQGAELIGPCSLGALPGIALIVLSIPGFRKLDALD
jgi:hypothetical protein